MKARTRKRDAQQYDSAGFGAYGGRVRVYRLRPQGNFYIEYNQGKHRHVIQPKTKDLNAALDYAAKVYSSLRAGLTPGPHDSDIIIMRAVFNSLALVSLPDGWPELGLDNVSRRVCEYYAISGPEKVYFIQEPVTQSVKIGRAINVDGRMREIQACCPTELRLLATADGGIVFESVLHRLFNSHRVRGEWFAWNDDLAKFLKKFLQNEAATADDEPA